ncbi:NAD(P)-dependent oxidoreductase [Paraburkholderia unamae]|uniref:3-hydroxyisobutyrate dehydrogenase-like beta-hydroxyacid dehydrogenase n=1 Tax=Paraburkholderia unamae TaxID=219649 RepID=A0ABX5KSN0_9BURK|nr:NAD(P)-dependent oxidoreductase [Paraburkholderia unamae]PVX85903.1 3-hydroxyisobutyrate dehydrogenase-like beta-hydroxyacid dehydrogenase [Paraburkholderia unamae]
MSKRVGIIGAGLMGLPMSINWLARGWEVMGYDVSPSRTALLAEAGAHVAQKIEEVAQFSDLIVLSLPSSAALDDVVANLASCTNAHHVIAETSTFAVEDKERAAARIAANTDAKFLDCPIIGGAVQAKTGMLTILGSGDEEAWPKTEPLWADTARQYRYVGSFGTASRLKFVVNHFVCTTTVLIAETMRFAERAGLDLALVNEIIGKSPASSGIWLARVPLMLSGIYDDPATKAAELAIPFKDTRIIADFIDQHGAPTPLFQAALDIYRVAQEQDRADQDAAALFEVFGSLTAQRNQ